MKKLKIASLLLILLTTFGVTRQIPAQTNNSNEISPSVTQKRPILKRTEQGEYIDQRATSDSKDSFLLRSGSNIRIPLTEAATLQSVLLTPLSTKGMKGVEMFRPLLVKTPVVSRYGQQLIPKDAVVETRISGQEAKTFDRAALFIEPQTVFVEIAGYIPIGTATGGETIYLKPGKWRLKIVATFRSLQSPDGQVTMYAKSDSESIIKGKRFGKEPQLNPSTGEYFDGLLYLNTYGSIAYGLTKIGKLFGFFFRRPNIVLPINTEVFFHIERVEATYLMPPLPKTSPQLLN